MRSPFSSLKLGVSSVLFDSPKFERILLIKRENPPLLGKWSFPGGKLEPTENVWDAIVRETFEETGYKIEIPHNTLFNITETKGYFILTGMAFIGHLEHTELGRPEKDLKIIKHFFPLDKTKEDSLWNLPDDEAIPGLKEIVEKFIYAYKGKF